MANRVSSAPTERASVVKGEPCNETESSQQSPEVDSRTVNVDCSSSSKVSSKHSAEGNGDGKPVKPGKDVTGVAAKSGSSAKSADNEVFIPAPPPATNAWTKRMQASCSAAKPATESACVPDKHVAARAQSDSKMPTHAPTDHSAESDPQSSKSRLEGSTQAGNTSSATVGSSKQSPVENAENPPSSKQTVEVGPKPGSEASSKAEVHVKSTSSASDTAPGGCWKIPVPSVCETSVGQGSSTSKQHSTESTSELSLCASFWRSVVDRSVLNLLLSYLSSKFCAN